MCFNISPCKIFIKMVIFSFFFISFKFCKTPNHQLVSFSFKLVKFCFCLIIANDIVLSSTVYHLSVLMLHKKSELYRSQIIGNCKDQSLHGIVKSSLKLVSFLNTNMNLIIVQVFLFSNQIFTCICSSSLKLVWFLKTKSSHCFLCFSSCLCCSDLILFFSFSSNYNRDKVNDYLCKR